MSIYTCGNKDTVHCSERCPHTSTGWDGWFFANNMYRPLLLFRQRPHTCLDVNPPNQSSAMQVVHIYFYSHSRCRLTLEGVQHAATRRCFIFPPTCILSAKPILWWRRWARADLAGMAPQARCASAWVSLWTGAYGKRDGYPCRAVPTRIVCSLMFWCCDVVFLLFSLVSLSEFGECRRHCQISNHKDL